MPTNWTATSGLVVECSHLKFLFTSSAVRGYQTSLQVHIKEEDRDPIRFHWLVDKDLNQIETRALFGLVQSLFILGGTLMVHLGGCKKRYPTEVDEILRSLYVDYVISGGNNISEVKLLKTTMITIFGEANFKRHKWH